MQTAPLLGKLRRSLTGLAVGLVKAEGQNAVDHVTALRHSGSDLA
jgi:hypothetical protein